MTTVKPTPNLSQTVELAPNYKIPLFLIIAAIPLVGVQPTVSLVIALLGLFLLIQTVLIRLQFTETDLDVYRSGKLIRRFPYKDWTHWEIYWNRVPILFYFREVKSIHFLPIIFAPETLKTCLEQRCPKQTK
ncbi:DUF3119 family protein [Gloeothece verrucosa]|uniref:Glycerol dehydrogenase n=1 Tax=Gloeothece verrucosa (strain PCC 7822) TaxID=497965 RepID=E0U5U7_GLOV7|nr:DUF3119 family protein [Gloeothece verrucosa]ADN15938.1 conserved hypothetical protein [Gloeothece verrucosa PCC 7822]